MNVRKTVFTREVIAADEMGQASDPITRVAAMAVVKNPFAGVHQNDLSPLFDVGAQLGSTLTQELVYMLGAPAVCYGKAALVGSSGAMEHRAALLHPRPWQTGARCHRGRQIPNAIQPQGWGVGRVD